MSDTEWNARILTRYALLQIPGLLLLVLLLVAAEYYWTDLPGWLTASLIALWVAKDVVLFPYVWRAYDQDHRSGDAFNLQGRTGTAEEDLDPKGFIRIRGERWKAELSPPHKKIKKGTEVKVVDRDGLTVQVEPVQEYGYSNTAKM